MRARLVVSLVLVLVLSLFVGGAVAGSHAVRSVRAEMQAALDVGIQTLRNGLQEMPATGDPGPELGRLVHMFDGDRHVRAVLRDATGRDRVSSVLHPLKPRMPRWFVDLLSPTLAPKYVNVDEDHTIILIPEPRNEISEVWTQLQDDCVAVGLFCGLSLLLTSLVVRHGLRPLERLSSALSTLSSGDYSVRIQPRGPPELARLADGVNAMAEQLQAAQARNLRLEEQLLRLQEEERADIARDLHDEIGPFLFAVRLDAAAIEHATKAGGSDQVRERAQAIRHAVGHMQVHVRSMLQRLRPVNPADVGLAQALDNLVAFWRARRPTIDLVLHIPDIDDGLGAPTVAAAYRLVQESLSNAIRHGDPSRIEISVVLQEAGMLRIDVIDDGTGLTTPKKPGLGLTGMRERIEALNGTLEIGPGKHGRGLAVIVYLPCTTVSEDA